MLDAFSIALPVVLAAVLIASGVAKLRHPDDLAGWAELGVPAVFRKTWLVRAHPWGEILLGAALVVFGGALGLLAAIAALALMAAYLWLVVRVLRRVDDASCACFGSRRPVTRVTVVRNAWLVVVALATAAVIWMNPLLGGAVGAASGEDWAWVVGLAIAAVTVAVVLWPDGEPAAAAVAADEDDESEYIRTRTPAVPVMLADGTMVNLRTLAAQRPILLLAVSDTCGACEPVLEQVPQWRELLPQLDVRLLLTHDPESGRWTERAEPQSLHDPDNYVAESIQDWGTPTAVLLGVDGMLAGGPVTGDKAIAVFVSDISEALQEQTAG